MTNCSGNTPRGHQYAFAPYGSAAAAAFTTRVALVRHGMRGQTNTVVDDSMKDNLWEVTGDEVIATEAVGGQIVLNPRAANLQEFCMCIFGDGAFAANVKLPGNICQYFQWGHADPYVDKIYRYNNCVTPTAAFAGQDVDLLSAWSENSTGTSTVAYEVTQRGGLARSSYSMAALNDTNPYVDWDLERPDATLDQLCQAVNAHVVLRSDDVAAIYPDGFGTDLPNIPSSSSSEAFEFGVIPGAVGITTAPFAWQFDFKLEPVGLDTDGSIVPLQKLSFTPRTQRGWYDSHPPEFAGLKQDVRKLAQATVFKWFRIVAPTGRMPVANMEIESIKQFLPLLENQLEFAKLSVEERAISNKVRMLDSDRTRLPAQVFGVFYDEEGTGSDNVPAFAINTIKQPELIYGKSFSIDNERGLVKFADPVFRYNPRSGTLSRDGKRQQELINPNIRLRTATNFRHAESGSAYRWHKKVSIKGGLDKSIIAWEAREDITPEWRVDRVKGVAINNIAEVERQLGYYLSFAQQRYEPKRPASGSYPWLVPYSPDRRIAQVIYEIDGEGFIGTSVHRDIEALLNIQSYQERRREVAKLATQQRDARVLTKQNEQKDKS